MIFDPPHIKGRGFNEGPEMKEYGVTEGETENTLRNNAVTADL